MTAIFISHSSADNLAAAEMKRWLEAQGHTSLFLDFDPEAGIKGGSGWEQTLYQRLRQCQAVIALLTPNWLASKWCFAELVQARERGKAIFPVKVQPCEAGGVFGDIQHLDLTTQPEEGYKRLKIGLLERGLDPLDVFDWDPKRPPYPGLMAFQEADAAIFFGRGEDILKTLETLDALRRQGREAARFALLLGASGSGKSSLARAGVIPRLKKRPAEWLPTPPFRPQVEPLDELAMALAAAFEAQGKPRDWSAICTELHTAAARNPVDGQPLLKLARDLAIAARQPETTMLLTIDQAEELFGYTPSESAARFLRLLRAALEAADRQLMVVATLRSDFLGQFQNHPVLQDSEYPHHFAYRAVPVDPMPLRSFPEIIQGPARLAGLQLGDGLVEAMVNDTGTRDALPLLAFTLRRLYERFGGDGHLTVDEYESLGRLEGAVREEAQRVIAEANPAPEELEALHAAFVPTMVRINADGGYARRRALFATMTQRAVALLRRFVDARLLVTDREAEGRETIEVAHEALLRTWPLLGGWLAEDQDKLRLLESIQRSAEEWQQGGRRDDLLVHRNGRLKDAEVLLANPRFTMPEASVERAYLNACSAAQQAREAAEKEEQERRIRDAERIAEEQKKAAEAERQRADEQATARIRQRRFSWGLVALLLLAAGIAYYALQQRGAAEERGKLALSRQLAAQASNEIGRDVRRAFLLATASYRAAPTNEARESLQRAFAASAADPPRTLLSHPKRTVQGVAFSPDGKTLASASEDTTVILWDVASGKPLGEPLKGHQKAVYSVAFSPDGKTLASASEDTTVILWEVASGKPVGEPLKGHQKKVYSVAFSPDGKTLASASQDATVILWDVASGKPVGEPLKGHQKTVYSVAFSPDGKTLASASEDTTVILWEVASGKPLGEPLKGHQKTVYSVAFRPDGKTLASASADTTVILWDVASGTPLGEPLKGHEGGVNIIAFSPDATTLASASEDTTVILWDVASGTPLGAPLKGHEDEVASVAFSPNGKTLASASGRTVFLRDVPSRTPLGEPLKTHWHNDNVQGVAFSPDGKTLASASGDILLWDVASRKQLGEPLKGDQERVLSVAFSPDGKTLAVTSDTIVLWDVASRKQLGEPLKGHSVAFSPDGKTLAAVSGDVLLWDVASRKQLGEPLKGDQDGVSSVAFSPDGKTLAVASGTIVLWDVASRKQLGEPLKGHQGKASSVAFSPDGKTLAVTSDTIVLWDVASRKQLGEPLKGDQGVWSVTFSPDGKTLASASEDTTVILWDVASRKPLGAPFKGHREMLSSVTFSPDGKTLASASAGSGPRDTRATVDTTVILWDVDVASWMRKACAIANRNLTHREWTQYVGEGVPYQAPCPELPVPKD